MPMPEEDIFLLIQIVQKDLDIKERRRFLENTPGIIAEIDKKIARMENEYQKNTGEIENLDKERRGLERKVNDQNDAINKKKIARESLKTNAEYKAMGHEIEYLTEQVFKEEERILSILELTEQKKKDLRLLSAKWNSEKEELLKRKQNYEDNMQKARENLVVLDDEKVRILPRLSEKVRRLYNRIIGVKGDSGVANLVNDICQGCYSRVPPQKAHEIRKNNRILTCEVCGRILVYFEVD
ncbi:MAG: hypothetical protein JXB45_12460 [Candidatus Krumholzibacteriota bacterium]|nr:hypothetical protein [Candidatus Krumholzibacteriota bacterium]